MDEIRFLKWAPPPKREDSQASSESDPLTRFRAEHLTIRTWASRSERLRGEPLAESALSSPSLAGIHLE